MTNIGPVEIISASRSGRSIVREIEEKAVELKKDNQMLYARLVELEMFLKEQDPELWALWLVVKSRA